MKNKRIVYTDVVKTVEKDVLPPVPNCPLVLFLGYVLRWGMGGQHTNTQENDQGLGIVHSFLFLCVCVCFNQVPTWSNLKLKLVELVFNLPSHQFKVGWNGKH